MNQHRDQPGHCAHRRRQTLVIVNERAERQGYYNGARTDIINSHADLRAALGMLIKAAEHTGTPQQ